MVNFLLKHNLGCAERDQTGTCRHELCAVHFRELHPAQATRFHDTKRKGEVIVLRP
jgi:hypothetical protein